MVKRTSTAYSPFFSEKPAESSLDAIADVLDKYPEHLIKTMVDAGTKIRPLRSRERFHAASAEMRRRGVNVDVWPVPPAGLFVVNERTLYLRSVTPMTICHELGHALDAALGGGIYHSSSNRAIRAAFREARRYVTPYAVAGIDEYWAEGQRAFLGVNDPGSPWGIATPQLLREYDPNLYAIIEAVFTVPATAKG